MSTMNLSARQRYDNRCQREAAALIRDVQEMVRPKELILIREKGRRDLIQEITRHLRSVQGDKVRTSGGDVWFVRKVKAFMTNKGEVQYEAIS